MSTREHWTTLSDTSPEAERVLREVYRRMPVEQKWLRLRALYREARTLHAAGVRLRQPGASARDIQEDWLHNRLGARPARLCTPVGEQSMDNLHQLREVLRALTRLGIPYALGGSMASSLHGIDRYTRDADITVEPFPGKEEALASSFGEDYYLSLAAIEDALRRRASFNIIHTTSGFKVGVFVRRDDPFEQSAMQRRITLDLPDAPGEPLLVHSPEDVLLFKLRWYRLGEETQSQQWSDVLGILKVQAGRLDRAYLDHWAGQLGVADLLQTSHRVVLSSRFSAPRQKIGALVRRRKEPCRQGKQESGGLN